VKPTRNRLQSLHAVAIALLLAASQAALGHDTGPDGAVVGEVHAPRAEHLDQQELYDLVRAGQEEDAFEEAFEHGDELFETRFNVLDGVGANVGQGQRFTRVPRADLNGPGEWAQHFPARATGPNAQACNSCHAEPSDDGAGSTESNVHRDPGHTGLMDQFIQRNTPHLFAPGALQRLAEEMTDDLAHIVRNASNRACRDGRAGARLNTKGVEFGRISVRRVRGFPCRVRVDTDRVEGIGPDLVVRPFQWKGNEATIRSFNRGAAHNEIGMQAVELVGAGIDGDFDGVVDELTIGDITALAVYVAAQPRPTTLLELNDLGLLEEPLTAEQIAAITRGRESFQSVGCESCHRSSLILDDPIFREPSRAASHRDELFPAGQDPRRELVDADFPVSFDLTQDQPDNVIGLPNGTEYRLGSLPRDSQGRAVVELFSDLKRHDLGADMAEPIDEAGTGRSMFLTQELWGVASTAPYMHDGRATTLTEAILFHGGEGAAARSAFVALSTQAKQDLVAFLDNLVLFKLAEEN